MNTLEELDQRTVVMTAINDLIEFINNASIEFNKVRFPNLQPQRYELDGGRKYIRISDSHGVHCFVNALTGDVYKAASYKAPVKQPRYNLLDAGSLAALHRNWDPYGSYLYAYRAHLTR